MDAHQEAEFERKAEKMLRGQREIPPGRDYRWNTFRFQQSGAEIDRRFDETFPNAPLGPEWGKRFCPKCDRPLSWCECKRGKA